ncbi:hypothetical protein [Solibacillus cecembensis]
MKLKNVIKTAIKYAPIVYPIVKKLIDNRLKSKHAKMLK